MRAWRWRMHAGAEMLSRGRGGTRGEWLLNIVCAKLIFFSPRSNNSKMTIGIFAWALNTQQSQHSLDLSSYWLWTELEFQQGCTQCRESEMNYIGQSNRENIQSRSIVGYKRLYFHVFLDFERQFNRRSPGLKFFPWISYEPMLLVTLSRILKSLSFCYFFSGGRCGVCAVEGLGICEMRTNSASNFVALCP